MGGNFTRFTMHPHQPAAPQGQLILLRVTSENLRRQLPWTVRSLKNCWSLLIQRSSDNSRFVSGTQQRRPWQVIVTDPREFRATILVKDTRPRFGYCH